jgi:hypothetical protein
MNELFTDHKCIMAAACFIYLFNNSFKNLPGLLPDKFTFNLI